MNQSQSQSSNHIHNWQLAKYIAARHDTPVYNDTHSQVIGIALTPAQAIFVCACGEFRTVKDKESL